MRKLRSLLLLPTIISIVLSAGFAFLSVRYSSAGDWVESLRDSLFFLMQSEVLLIILNALLQAAGLPAESRLRALIADRRSLRCLSAVENACESLLDAGQPFLIAELDRLVGEFQRHLAPLKEGGITIDARRIGVVTNDLYANAKKKVQAVSLIDVRSYWLDPEYFAVAIARHSEASTRGVAIERIIVVQRSEEIVAFSRMLQRLIDAGCEIRYILMGDIAEELRADFSIYDEGKYVQVLTFHEETFNKTVENCTVSVDKGAIEAHLRIYEELHRRSKVLDLTTFEVASSRAHSLWFSKEFRDHYEGEAPELNLELIDGPIGAVLDVGCGAGRTLKLFADTGCECVGIDQDETATTMCRLLLGSKDNVEIQTATFDANSFPGRTFDLVIAYNVVYHCRSGHMISLIRRMPELLREGGHLLLTIKTLEGNEKAIQGGIAVEKNTWINCNMPDYWELHHFCDSDEQSEIDGIFSKRVFSQEIPMVEKDGVIVQAAGMYLILQK